MTTPTKTQCCKACHDPIKNSDSYRCDNSNCPCHQKSVGEIEESHDIDAAIDRLTELGFAELYNQELGAIDVLKIVHEALDQRERAVRSEIRQLVKESFWQCPIHDDLDPVECKECAQAAEVNVVLVPLLQALNNQPEV